MLIVRHMASLTCDDVDESVLVLILRLLAVGVGGRKTLGNILKHIGHQAKHQQIYHSMTFCDWTLSYRGILINKVVGKNSS